MGLSVGGIGMMKEEVTFVGAPMLSREAALAVTRAFLVPEDMGTPPGAVALRGATNFQTPSGWDTVYSPIFNMIERPVAPMLAIRVETDWYAHETEFRYVLQAGEGITVEHSMPIGQVFFVPREPITMRPCTSDGDRGDRGVTTASSTSTRRRPRRRPRTGCRTARTISGRAARRKRSESLRAHRLGEHREAHERGHLRRQDGQRGAQVFTLLGPVPDFNGEHAGTAHRRQHRRDDGARYSTRFR